MVTNRSIVFFACFSAACFSTAWFSAAIAQTQYTGSEACRSCHAANFASQSKTGHAHALSKAPAGAPGQWAFGAGVKATTWVSQLDRDTWAEHGLSYFAGTRSMGLTPGHDTADDVRYRTFDPEATVLRCFRCHSTGALSLGANYSIQPGEPGIHCETCHVNSRGAPGTLINPARLSAAELNDFCGTCHRNAPESDWTDKWKTRHQPSYLAQSACFRNSNGALKCITCHNPHNPLNEVAAQYNPRCIECHKEVRHSTPPAAGRACADCHMPQVTVSAQLKFTNHWIGIYSGGSAGLVPSRSVAKVAPAPAGDRSVSPPAEPASLRPLFEQALADREEELEAGDPRVARSASDLGLFLNSIGDAAGAEKALRRALEIDSGKADPQLAGDAENLAEILASAGRTTEAFPLFRQASASPTAKVAALAFANLATLDPAHAEDYYRRAIDAERRALKPDPKRLAILLNDLALTVEQKKDYKTAESLMREALAIQSKTQGAESPAAATTMNNLGSLLESAGQHPEAELLERRAMRILELKLGPRSAELATSCTNLADILWTKGDRISAARLYQRAISIDESVYGPENPEVAGDLVNYGTLLKETGQKDMARQVLRRALGIYEKASGPGSPEAARVRDLLQ
jgi:tetratricopeptide (TPR) repeat protein